MKTKKVILFSIANLLALVIIWAVAERLAQQNRYGTQFRPHSFIMSDTVDCNASADEVYRFYIHHYDEIYSRTASIHHEFTLLNRDSIAPGAEIYCREGEHNRMIVHQYFVDELVPERHISMSSTPSVVRLNTKRGMTERECNAFVFVDFIEESGCTSRVAMTIAIQLPNYFFKLAGIFTGGKAAKNQWEGHLREELEGFAACFQTLNHN